MIPFVGVLGKILLGPITDLAGKYIENQTSREKFQAELQGILAEQSVEFAKVQASVINTEANGNWLQRGWRPFSALCFLWIVMWFGWLQPATVAWYGWTPLRVGDPLLLQIIELLKVCLGGYIAGRSVEKVASTVATVIEKRRKE